LIISEPKDRAPAANELTQEQWDPSSKQPIFKSGAVRIEKGVPDSSGVIIHAKEKQSTAREKVGREKPDAHDISNPSVHPRERYLRFWLRATYEAIYVLIEICGRLIPQYICQDEVHAGVMNFYRISERMGAALAIGADKYGEQNQYGLGVSKRVRHSLFPDYEHEHTPNTYKVLFGLQALYIYCAHVESHLKALMLAAPGFVGWRLGGGGDVLYDAGGEAAGLDWEADY